MTGSRLIPRSYNLPAMTSRFQEPRYHAPPKTYEAPVMRDRPGEWAGVDAVAPPWTGAQPDSKRLPRKSRKRVLLEPATVSPKRALIQAAVEKVASERERREAAQRAVARKAKKRAHPKPDIKRTNKDPKDCKDIKDERRR